MVDWLTMVNYGGLVNGYVVCWSSLVMVNLVNYQTCFVAHYGCFDNIVNCNTLSVKHG